MKPSLPLLLALAASHVPVPAVAQRGHIGFGAGASHIEPGSGSGLRAATRASIAARAAFGSRRIRAVLDWQRHGLGDEQPLPTDLQGDVLVRRPQVLRTEFLLLGVQFHFTPGFYVRPALGLGRNSFPVYDTNTGAAEVSGESALTGGLSAGYQLRLHRHFSLAIEGSLLGSPGEDSSEGRTVIGIQVVPLLEF